MKPVLLAVTLAIAALALLFWADQSESGEISKCQKGYGKAIQINGKVTEAWKLGLALPPCEPGR